MKANPRGVFCFSQPAFGRGCLDQPYSLEYLIICHESYDSYCVYSQCKYVYIHNVQKLSQPKATQSNLRITLLFNIWLSPHQPQSIM